MSASAARRARLLRLRIVEHRIAAARLVAAESAHAAVTTVCDRVAAMRDAIAVVSGRHAGYHLQSLSEMTERLDRARIGLQPTLAEALAVRTARDSERIAASVAEERTSRAHASASYREAADRERRAAAALPTRLVKRDRL